MVCLREATKEELDILMKDESFVSDFEKYNSPLVLKDIHSTTYFLIDKNKIKVKNYGC